LEALKRRIKSAFFSSMFIFNLLIIKLCIQRYTFSVILPNVFGKKLFSSMQAKGTFALLSSICSERMLMG
uniref:hypothetical protein n=1 Tax=Prevotella sp. TaxID=59823 RepID=UPI003FF0C3E6